MKAVWWIPAAFLASAVLSIETQPFSPPATAETSTSKRAFDILNILKRDGNCPAGHSGCSSLGNANVCCQDNSVCSRDAANNIACCPTGASCTGSLTATKTTGVTSSSFQFPSSVTATVTTGAGPTITGSTINGAYPFVYVPTTFANAQTCSSYYSMCQNSYSSCTVQLGGRYGVTVAAAGGGVTVQGGAATAAVSTCSSLSAEACHGLNLGYCGTYSTAGGFSSNNAAPPGRVSNLQDLVLGVAVGAAGMFL